MTEPEGLNFRSIEHMPRLVGVEDYGASDRPRSAASPESGSVVRELGRRTLFGPRLLNLETGFSGGPVPPCLGMLFAFRPIWRSSVHSSEDISSAYN